MTNQPSTQTVDQTPAEHALAELIVSSLQLEVAPEEIEPEGRLFGEGLGLDSIDALEIGIVLRKHYQLTIAANDERTREHFRSINALAELVASQRETVRASGDIATKGE